MRKPDYAYHANLDEVDDFASATWLLVDKDPTGYPWEVRIDSLKQSYDEKEWKLYKILEKNNWEIFKDAPYYRKHVLHIFMLVIVAKNKNLPLPDELFNAVDERYKREYKVSILDDELCNKKLHEEKLISTRERTSYLNILGAVLNQYLTKVKHSSQSSLIGNIVDQYPKTPGLSRSNLEKKFAEAIESLNYEK